MRFPGDIWNALEHKLNGGKIQEIQMMMILGVVDRFAIFTEFLIIFSRGAREEFVNVIYYHGND